MVSVTQNFIPQCQPQKKSNILIQNKNSQELTSRTPNAFATPANETSECIGPSPPNKNTCKYKVNDQFHKELKLNIRT